MKFALILLSAVAYVALASADPPVSSNDPPVSAAEHCPGRQENPNCLGGKDEGRGGRQCHRHKNDNMWYFNHRTRECTKMKYLGCGGNKNRYCSKRECDQNCRRRT